MREEHGQFGVAGTIRLQVGEMHTSITGGTGGMDLDGPSNHDLRAR